MKKYRFKTYSLVGFDKEVYRQEWKAKSKPRYRLLASVYNDMAEILCLL